MLPFIVFHPIGHIRAHAQNKTYVRTTKWERLDDVADTFVKS